MNAAPKRDCPRVQGLDKGALIREGIHRAPPGVEPAWLVGRRVLIKHASIVVRGRAVWYARLKVLRRGRVSEELLDFWPEEE